MEHVEDDELYLVQGATQSSLSSLSKDASVSYTILRSPAVKRSRKRCQRCAGVMLFDKGHSHAPGSMHKASCEMSRS